MGLPAPDGEPADRSGLDPQVAEHVEPNALTLLAAQSLTKFGDRIVDPKTVLPYLLAAGGAPAALVGLLVPIRESGSLLPQVALLSLVHRVRYRHRLLVGSALGQSFCVGLLGWRWPRSP